MNSHNPNQTNNEEAEGKILKTVAQVEANPGISDGKISSEKLPRHFPMAASDQPFNGIKNSTLQESQEMNFHSERLNMINDAIELTTIETNGRKSDIRSTRPSSQSPRTMPRCHASQKRQVHNDIHSASASPSIPSRTAHQYINHGQDNHSSQIGSPQIGYGARSSLPSIQSPAGVQSFNSDSPSLVHGQDSNEDSTLVVAPSTRKEALQHKVIMLHVNPNFRHFYMKIPSDLY